MKKMFLLCCVFVFVLAGCGFAAVSEFDPSKEPKDFRGIKWGQNIDTIKDKQDYEQRGKVQVFSRKNDRMRIGPVTLSVIWYSSVDKKLTIVAMVAEGKDASNLFDEAVTLYGPPSRGKNDKNGSVHLWEFPSVQIVYMYDISKRESSLTFTYKPLKKRYDEEMEKVG